ncbi:MULTISPECIES: hypothetical protein [unclassified Endozoicomonas]|uniref:hypothetical protein n=1 Tax=unclassified Endozoicomonas TaxID=2644528 RepID=UPI002149471D|nr:MULTISPECIES: hypothetical protein [unclassified Endozoicomonas]
MRTTVDLEPGLLAQLKEQAARERTTVSQLANQLIRMAIATQQNKPRNVLFQWYVAKNSKPAEGFDPSDRSYLDDLV